jgi:hypothetical protein
VTSSSELDQPIHSDVKFGNGSIIKIRGHGSIVFSGRNRQHKVLTGSFGQLDEGGSKVKIEDGVLSIWDR